MFVNDFDQKNVWLINAFFAIIFSKSFRNLEEILFDILKNLKITFKLLNYYTIAEK